MPYPPDKLKWEINILTEFWSAPCQTTLIVYIESLYEASKNLVFTLLSFGFDDVVRGFFRPVAARRWRHGRKGRKGRFRKALIPETGEIVAKWIPGAEAVEGRWVDDGVRMLWELDHALQKVLYFILIFDVIDEFWTDLNTGIITSDASDCSKAEGLMRKGRPQITGPQGWVIMDAEHLIYQQGDVFSDEFGCQVGAGQWMCIVSSNIFAKGSNPNPLTCGVRARAESVFGEKEDNGSVATIETGETHSSIANLKVNGPCFITWEGLVVGNEADFKEFQVNVMKIGNPQV